MSGRGWGRWRAGRDRSTWMQRLKRAGQAGPTPATPAAPAGPPTPPGWNAPTRALPTDRPLLTLAGERRAQAATRRYR